MTDVKPWYLSKGVLGPLVTVLALAAGLFGIKIDEATQALIVDQATGAITAAVALIGALVGIYGRVTATSQIK